MTERLRKYPKVIYNMNANAMGRPGVHGLFRVQSNDAEPRTSSASLL